MSVAGIGLVMSGETARDVVLVWLGLALVGLAWQMWREWQAEHRSK